MNATSTWASAAFAFILIMGGVNLFADVTYAVAIQMVAVPIFLSARRSMSPRSA